MITKSFFQFTFTALTAASLSLTSQAADISKKADKAPAKAAMSAPASSPASSPAEMSGRALPFQGKIASVDKAAKTFTIESKKGEGRTFVVPDTVKPVKGSNAPATWDELTVGQIVRGTYRKNADGKSEIVSLQAGPKEASDKAEKSATPKSGKSDKAESKPAAEPKK